MKNSWGILGLAVAALSGLMAPQGEAKQRVFVSIAPLAHFVEKVGGERVQVDVLVQAGDSPATYEPSARQMAALSEAAVLFRVGVPFENALVPKLRSAMKQLRIVDTRKGIKLRQMESCDHDGHDHHHHEGDDPHIWTSPRLAKVQARTIADALTELDPAGAQFYTDNFTEFAKELDGLDNRLKQSLDSLQGKTLMVFHPSWGYFADDYGLVQESIEAEGKEPSARQLARIIERAKASGVRVIFVQPQFSRSGAEAVAAAIGAVVVPIDPLARDYVANLERVAKAVREAVAGQN